MTYSPSKISTTFWTSQRGKPLYKEHQKNLSIKNIRKTSLQRTSQLNLSYPQCPLYGGSTVYWGHIRTRTELQEENPPILYNQRNWGCWTILCTYSVCIQHNCTHSFLRIYTVGMKVLWITFNLHNINNNSSNWCDEVSYSMNLFCSDIYIIKCFDPSSALSLAFQFTQHN